MFRLAFPRGQGPAYADLPPTLQPRAIAASAPPSDHVRTAAFSGLIYLLLGGAAMVFFTQAPRVVRGLVGPTRPERVVEFDPPPTTPPLVERHAIAPSGGGGGTIATTAPISSTQVPTEASSEKQSDNHLLIPVGVKQGPVTTGTPQVGPGPSEAIGSRVHDVSSTGLAILHRVDPIYPDFARRAHLQGIVVLLMTVDEHGQPTSVTVQEGHAAFHEAAMQAARQWRFEPAQVEGRAVSARFRLTLKFSLR